MSYIDIKLIKGHLYGYVRQSIRIGKRVIHKNIAYLGAISPIHRAKQEPITFEARPIKEPVISEPKAISEPVHKPITEPRKRVKIERKVRLPKFKIDVGKGSRIKDEAIHEDMIIKKEIKRKKKSKKEPENLFRIG